MKTARAAAVHLQIILRAPIIGDMNAVRSNVWKVYIFKFLGEFYLIAPVLIPYYKSNGLNVTQVFTIQAVYALSILVFEIPSGYLADVIGRKKTLLIGAYGVLFAVYQLSSALGSSKAHAVEKKIGLKRALLLSLGVAPVFVLLGAMRSPFLIPLVSLNAYLWGMSYPLLLDSLNRLTPSDVRATTLSTANMAGSVSYVVLSPLFGWAVDATSLSTAFILLGVLFAASGSAVLAALLPRLRADA